MSKLSNILHKLALLSHTARYYYQGKQKADSNLANLMLDQGIRIRDEALIFLKTYPELTKNSEVLDYLENHPEIRSFKVQALARKKEILEEKKAEDLRLKLKLEEQRIETDRKFEEIYKEQYSKLLETFDTDDNNSY